LPIGGVAQLERMPRKPLQEFLIALAGPFVNFVLVGLLLPITLFVVGIDMRSGSLRLGTASLMAHMQSPSLSGLLLYLTGTNLLLGVFNLLPAFPMDGGRILRALLALGIPYVRATRIAVLVGRGMAFLFALWGIFGGGIFLLLIAFFVYVGGRAELEAVESRSALKGIRARQALTTDAIKLYTSEKINKAVDLILSSYQTDFPVFDLANRFTGVLTRNRLIQVLREAGPEARISDAMIPAERLPVVEPDTPLADVWDAMIQNHTRVVVVKEAGVLFQGLITLEDITEVIQVMGATRDSELRRGPSVAAAEESLPKV
jgi:CBS domain-containing protein